MAIVFKIKNIYKLTNQCQRIYKSMIQLNKIERVVNEINQQKQRRIVILNVIFPNVIFFRTFSYHFRFYEKKISKTNHVCLIFRRMQHFD